MRWQFHHLIDSVPTILEATGIRAPDMVTRRSGLSRSKAWSPRAALPRRIDARRFRAPRADNVVAYLTSQGVNPNVISAKGFSDTHPVAANDTPDGRVKDRSIEIVTEGPGA